MSVGGPVQPHGVHLDNGRIHPGCAEGRGAEFTGLRVTFLGTGAGPAVGAEWAGPSTLVEFGNEAILIDAGRGLVQRLQLLNRRVLEISSVFLTHLHSDHTVGLPEFWLSDWWKERRSRPLEVRGPKGTRGMAEHIEKAWSYPQSPARESQPYDRRDVGAGPRRLE